MRKLIAILSAVALGLIGLFAFSAPAQADGENDLISWTVECGEVTFTNLADVSVLIEYGVFGSDTADDSVELGPGESQTISTDREWIDFFVGYVDSYDPLEGGTEVPQDCKETGPTKTKKKPKVAPAAGI